MPDTPHPRVNGETAISSATIGKEQVVLSSYRDDRWFLPNSNTNYGEGKSTLDFQKIPEPYREALKQAVHNWITGRTALPTPASGTVAAAFMKMRIFLTYISGEGVNTLRDISEANYEKYVAVVCSRKGHGGSAAKEATAILSLGAVRILHTISAGSSQPLPEPWPEADLSSLVRPFASAFSPSKQTDVIPDPVLIALFQAASEVLAGADKLLDARDVLAQHRAAGSSLKSARCRAVLTEAGLGGGRALTQALIDVRTASYIVIASLSGCRNHELAFLEYGAHYTTEVDGVEYHWMKSRSTKGHTGDTEWMIPHAAVVALRVMERWSAPLRVRLGEAINLARAANPKDVRAAKASAFSSAIFLSEANGALGMARTMTIDSWSRALRQFCSDHDIPWRLATHHFRRTFAVLAARSNIGDLRYLREHFKHWHLDLTLLYALNGHQSSELYEEVQEELECQQLALVDVWLNPDTRLSGGAGRSVTAFRQRHPIPLYRTARSMLGSTSGLAHLRSNGHAWCTAGVQDCVGNSGIERLRCTACKSSVITTEHASFYAEVYAQQSSLVDLDDIGKAGRERAIRDRDRCAVVLRDLGVPIEG
jgi:hypothetical protein